MLSTFSFMVEARKQDGSFYPPGSLYNLACGLLRKLRDLGIYDMNFMDEKNTSFAKFREVLDAQMKKLTKEGLGTKQREAQPVTEGDEKTLWAKSAFGSGSAVALQNTMYFYNCKIFGLRGYDEHRNLCCNQFMIGSDENGRFVEFRGTNSKTYNGGLKHRRVDPKVIRHYDENSGIVDLYQMYLNALGKAGVFYRRPLASETGVVRYSEQAVGVNKLRTFMKDMCAMAGLEGRYSNHSGKKTCATTLYQKGIPEEEIMKRTGHRSIAGVRKYQKPSQTMLKDISNTLNPPLKSDKVTCGTLNMDSKTDEVSDSTVPKVLENLEQSGESHLKELFTGNHSFTGCTFHF